MKQHHFDIEHAASYGVDEAIMINAFQYWILHNRANGKNQYDGHTWTYNSIEALAELFPYWTQKQVRRIVDSLKAKGVLITGNYNKKNYDRTTWYAFENESLFLNGQTDLPVWANGSAQIGKRICPDGQTIPVNIPINNTVDNREARANFQPPTVEEVFSFMTSEKNLEPLIGRREAEKFHAHYESNGWRVGKNKMQKWRAAASGWVSRMKDYFPRQNNTNGQATNAERGPLISEEIHRRARAILMAED